MRFLLKLEIMYWSVVLAYADWRLKTALSCRAIRHICYARADLHQLMSEK
jgi:hypothetical protein